MARVRLCLVLACLTSTSALQLPLGRAPLPLVKPPVSRRVNSPCTALYEDDPWLQSADKLPWSGASLEALFKYGPVVYAARCVDPAEYNASVRKIMERYPRISRALAEQEINLFLADGTAYLASQTEERKRKGPSEDELAEPVGLADKFLVVAWVAILIPSVNFIAQAAMVASNPRAPQIHDMNF